MLTVVFNDFFFKFFKIKRDESRGKFSPYSYRSAETFRRYNSAKLDERFLRFFLNELRPCIVRRFHSGISLFQ